MKKTTLSCEQVYEIWKNEPSLIVIYDLRSSTEYENLHIPGSKNVELIQLLEELNKLGNKLAVVVTPEDKKETILNDLKNFENFVIVQNFHRWANLTHKKPELTPIPAGDIFELTCQNTYENLEFLRLVDVRRPDEFNGELGHIHNAKLATLGPELTEHLHTLDKELPIAFVCRSGKRSETATIEAKVMGFKNIYNMSGGMICWNECHLPIEKK